MFVDHIGFLFFPEILWFRIIGRTAFILYAFMIVEGAIYTSNIQRYLKKILLWGILSEVPFDLFFHETFWYLESQNIFFTLLIGLLGVQFISKNKNVLLQIVGVGIGMLLGYLLRVDYSWYGVALIYSFYFFRQHSVFKFLYSQILSSVFAITHNILQIFAFVGLIPIYFYNGKQGYKFGSIYYSFYAIHLLILYAVSKVLLC